MIERQRYKLAAYCTATQALWCPSYKKTRMVHDIHSMIGQVTKSPTTNDFDVACCIWWSSSSTRLHLKF